MRFIEAFLILAALNSAPTDDRYPEAVEVYSCDFDESADVDFDLWPDRWTRRRGRGYPLYLKVEIADVQDPKRRCLRCDLDGGGIAVFSPHIEISPSFSYILDGLIRTEALKNNAGYYSITFCDSDHKPLETVEGSRFRGNSGWQQIRIGPLTPSHPNARFAVVELHVESSGETDIKGTVFFDDIWFGRFPLVTLAANSEHRIYQDPKKVMIHCKASGMSDPSLMLNFELLDVYGNQLSKVRMPLTSPPPIMADVSGSPGLLPSWREQAGTAVSGAQWSPPIPENGFYKVRVSMPGRSGMLIERTLNLVVAPQLATLETGEFGWSLPQGEDPLPIRSLVTLLLQTGTNWVKYPMWFGGKGDERNLADRLSWLVERLDSHHIQLVGMLDQPPEEIRTLFEEKGRLPVASVFVESDSPRALWRTAIDPVMMRMSLKVRWWQLGRDDDTSFVEFPHLESTIRQIKQHINRFGQEVELGFPWPSVNETPRVATPPWDFLAHTSDPSLTREELRHHFENSERSDAKRWVTLQPLARSQYGLATRAEDLVSRMLEAKIGGADAIFATNPFDPETGLMEPDGQPGPLFLPWRTTAAILAGTQYIGSVTLPHGSNNYVFARGNEAVMVMWNHQATNERLYLGDQIKTVDVWGRIRNIETELDSGKPVQTIEVGPLPIFVQGVSLPVAKWRMSFRFETEKLASLFGREQSLPYHFENHFPQGVGGELLFNAPNHWDLAPRKATFKLAANEDNTDSIFVILRSDARSGNQPLRIDFKVTADRDYQFDVYSTMHVGLDDIFLELNTRLDDDGNLVIDQHLVNRTDRLVSFNCLLFVPDRRRQRKQIFSMGKGRSTVSYTLPNGSEVLGKTLWLRAEELSGSRILNYQVVAEP